MDVCGGSDRNIVIKSAHFHVLIIMDRVYAGRHVLEKIWAAAPPAHPTWHSQAEHQKLGIYVISPFRVYIDFMEDVLQSPIYDREIESF